MSDRLRDALNEGRINLMEYDERLQQAYSAKTYGELDKLLDDLPKVTPVQASQVATAASAQVPAAGTDGPAGAPEHHGKGWLAGIWGGWVTTSLVCTAIWAATALTSGSYHNFWPIWVIVPFGAACLASTIRRLAGDQSHGQARRRQREYRYERRDRRRGRY